MMQIHPTIAIGSLKDCPIAEPARHTFPTIHACKHPCHARAVGYKRDIHNQHKNYLAKLENPHLYLNLVDPEVALFYPNSFIIAMNFLDFYTEALNAREVVLIHCNKGLSRAPSIALLWLAKRAKAIPDDSYTSAAAAFKELYPLFSPGRGICAFLQQKWTTL